MAYKLPNISTSDLDSIINGLSTNNLNSTQQQLLQNRTQDLASIPIPKANLTATVTANGSSITNSSGIQLATADDVGEFDQFVTVPGLGSNDSSAVQVVQTGIANVTGPGNGTVILVPSRGFSVVSDIDDVLRITKVYVPNQGLYNSFVQPYVNVPGIPELFAKWSKSLPGAAFHYDTTTPLQLTRTYVDYLFSNFPLGSLEMRPINLTEPSQILEARQDSLLKLFQTFPQRKFGASPIQSLLTRYAHDTHVLSSLRSPCRRYVLLDAALGVPTNRSAVPRQHRVHLHQEYVLHRLGRQDPIRHQLVQEHQERHLLLLPHRRGYVSLSPSSLTLLH